MTDEYVVEGADVGDIILIKLYNDQGRWFERGNDWFVARVHITTENPSRVYQFPCYRWVQTELTLFEGKCEYFLEHLRLGTMLDSLLASHSR